MSTKQVERWWPKYDVMACKQLGLDIANYAITSLGFGDIDVIDTGDLQITLANDDVSLYDLRDLAEIIQEKSTRVKLPPGHGYVELSRVDDLQGPKIAAIVDLRGDE